MGRELSMGWLEANRLGSLKRPRCLSQTPSMPRPRALDTQLKGPRYPLMGGSWRIQRDGIARLLQCVVTGQLVIDVRLYAVHSDDHDALASVAALNAQSITWSNVCEYCPPQEFHRMARACSGANTVHYAHVMNWLLYVKGSRCVVLFSEK